MQSSGSHRVLRLLLGVLLAAAAVFSLSLSGSLPGRAGRAAAAATSRAAVAAAYGRLPLAFEPNRGQVRRQALFVARGAGYTLLLTRRQALLRLSAGRAGRRLGASRSATLRIGFVGASRAARVAPVGRLPGQVNYLIGRRRADWHTHIPTYANVRYEGLWPGIGATFYGHGGRLEYDLQVAAGADPARIGLSFGGAKRLSLARDGTLLVRLPGGSVRQLRPHAYQLVDGARRAVASRYVLERGGRVRVRLGAYDHSRPLVIDPSLFFSTYLGGTGTEVAFGIAINNSGNAYISGATTSTNFPTTPNAYQRVLTGGLDAFVTELSSNGRAFVFSTYIGGDQSAAAVALAIDSSNNVYVAGGTTSPNFPTTPNAPQRTFGGVQDAFVTKLNSTGSSLVYSTYLGGSLFDNADGIAVGPASGSAAPDAYVTGWTQSTNFPTTPGVLQGSNAGVIDGFVTRLASNGQSLVYSTYLGGSFNDIPADIAVDTNGRAYVAGSTSSHNFPTSPNALIGSWPGTDAAFVSIISPHGTLLPYSTYLGGSAGQGATFGGDIALNRSNDSFYVTGFTSSTDFPTTSGVVQPAIAGVQDAFVTRFNVNGTLVYSTYLGGTDTAQGTGIAVASNGRAYVTGWTNSTNFPTHTATQHRNGCSPPSCEPGPPGQNAQTLIDAFVTELNPSGSSILFSTYLGGMGTDQGVGIVVDNAGDPTVVGFTWSTDFPVTHMAAQGTNGGVPDAFITKFSL